jgi:phosphate:Na+ symporter
MKLILVGHTSAMQTTDALIIAFNIIGGLALFMFGITLLRETLGKITGKRVARILEKTTDSPVKGMAIGTGTTFMTQSSSITCLTLIGFVNAGMMTFRQSVHVMLGSEIGTTLTAQMVAFEIGLAYWPLIATGFFAKFFSKNEKVKLVGSVIFSLGLIFLAMDFMKQGAKPLGESEFFVSLMNSYGENPIMGILVGTIIAGITQSSSATTSLVIALGMGGVINLETGIALIMGANIGTCFLELFAGIGATVPAKRTAVAQSLINILGVLIFFPFIQPFASLMSLTSDSLPRQIANAHSIFNILVSLIFIPLVGPLVMICERIVPEKEGEIIGKHYFDEKMLHMPHVALMEAEKEIHKTADLTLKMIQHSRSALLYLEMDDAQRVQFLEDEVDDKCRTTEEFIDKIREEELGEDETLWRMKLLAILTDIERVGDLSQNLAEFAVEREKSEISFSNTAVRHLKEMFNLVEKTYSTAVDALKTRHKDIAKLAVNLEDEVDVLERKLKEAHRQRMREGVCMPEADTIFVETLRNLERISDHADNIALDVIMKY